MNHVFVVSCQFEFRASLNYLVELVAELLCGEWACFLDVVFHFIGFFIGFFLEKQIRFRVCFRVIRCWRQGRDFARFLRTMLALESH